MIFETGGTGFPACPTKFIFKISWLQKVLTVLHTLGISLALTPPPLVKKE